MVIFFMSILILKKKDELFLDKLGGIFVRKKKVKEGF